MEQTTDILHIEPVWTNPSKTFAESHDVVKPIDKIVAQPEEKASEKITDAKDKPETTDKKEASRTKETMPTKEANTEKTVKQESTEKKDEERVPKEKPIPVPTEHLKAYEEANKIRNEYRSGYKMMFEETYQKVIKGKMTVSELLFERGTLIFLRFLTRLANRIVNRFTKKKDGIGSETSAMLDEADGYFSMKIAIYSAVIAAVGGDFSVIQDHAKEEQEKEHMQLEKRNQLLKSVKEDMQHPSIKPHIDQYDLLDDPKAKFSMYLRLRFRGSPEEKIAGRWIAARKRMTQDIESVTNNLTRIENLHRPSTYAPPKNSFVSFPFHRPPTDF